MSCRTAQLRDGTPSSSVFCLQGTQIYTRWPSSIRRMTTTKRRPSQSLRTPLEVRILRHSLSESKAFYGQGIPLFLVFGGVKVVTW